MSLQRLWKNAYLLGIIHLTYRPEDQRTHYTVLPSEQAYNCFRCFLRLPTLKSRMYRFFELSPIGFGHSTAQMLIHIHEQCQP